MLIYFVLLLIVLVFGSHLWIARSSTGKLFSRLEDIPSREVALVLGTNPKVNGRENLFFEYRMEAAAALWKSGKVKCLLLSGDNHTRGYDEPTAMRNALIARGVPDSVMTLDYAGFRTLDSVVRCKEVFGQKKIIIISQRFHNERALFIAKKNGVDAIAFNAQELSFGYSVKTSIREYFARTKCVLDLYVLNAAPKFLGQQEVLNGMR